MPRRRNPSPVPPAPRLSVAVCAHNEARTITQTVESLLEQTVWPESVEIILVDNGSTDGTLAVMGRVRNLDPARIRVVREQTLGLSHARNRALEEARGEMTAFIDADAVADPAWITSLLVAFDVDETIAAIGGPVEIRWDHPRPAWWDERLAEALNAWRPADFTVRTEVARSAGGFATSLGRRGRGLLAGEEGELCLRMERAGHSIHYTPDAVVHHRTAASRLRRRYILRRALQHGRSQRLLETMHGLESGRYLSWPAIAARLCGRGLRFDWDLPFLKFILFRIGYQYQRSIGGLPGRSAT
ncbi:MAG: glycosyltransferase family 2 protein [Planctomycetota bacterium]